MGKRLGCALVVVVVLLAGMPGVASGLISTVSGQIIQISPPPSVLPGVLQNATSMVAFNERQGVTLSAALPVDIVMRRVPTTRTATSSNGTVPAGTRVDSHFMHSDRTGGRHHRAHRDDDLPDPDPRCHRHADRTSTSATSASARSKPPARSPPTPQASRIVASSSAAGRAATSWSSRTSAPSSSTSRPRPASTRSASSPGTTRLRPRAPAGRTQAPKARRSRSPAPRPTPTATPHSCMDVHLDRRSWNGVLGDRAPPPSRR